MLTIAEAINRLIEEKNETRKRGGIECLIKLHCDDIDTHIKFLESKFKEGKRYIHQIPELKPENRYEYFIPEDKVKYFEEHNPFGPRKLDTIVECMHCGKVYPLSEYIVQRDKLEGKEYICCKNHKKCNGTLIDLMPVQNKK